MGVVEGERVGLGEGMGVSAVDKELGVGVLTGVTATDGTRAMGDTGAGLQLARFPRTKTRFRNISNARRRMISIPFQDKLEEIAKNTVG